MICGVLLAAGSSTRFGSDKLLSCLPDGTPIGVASACRLLAAVDHAIAVVRPGDGRLAATLEGAGLQVATCPQAHRGMGASLAHGVAVAPEADGWLIALADMPRVRPLTIRAVADSLRRGAAVAAPVFQGRRGHPVGFGREFYEELAGLDGDHGARFLLAGLRDRIHAIDCDDPGILLDIDTPQDLERLGWRP